MKSGWWHALSQASAQTDKHRNFYAGKCAHLDKQIDALVHELYGLTAEEIQIVEEGQR